MKTTLNSCLRLLLIATVLASGWVLAAGSAAVVWIDVRSVEEYQAGHIEGDVFMPYKEIGHKIEALIADKNTPIKVYCRSGRRAGIAKQTLEALGYTRVENVGGIAETRKLRVME